MTYDELLAYCLAKPGAWRDTPWEDDVVVKVADKIFAFLGGPHEQGESVSVGLKCGADAETAREWRDRYPDDAHVMAYLGRYGWNTLAVGAATPDEDILEAVDASYEAVVARLPRSRRPAAAG